MEEHFIREKIVGPKGKMEKKAEEGGTDSASADFLV